jgi:Flp pilus assembly protein TadB
MHMDDAGRSAKIGSGRIWGLIMRLAGLFLAGVALLAILVVGLFFLLPLMLIGGIALYFYLRRRLRQARQRSWDGAIDAECTVIERR